MARKRGFRRFRTLRWRIPGLFVLLFSAGAAISFVQYYYLFESLSTVSRQQTHADVATQIAERLKPALDRDAAFSELRRIGEEAARFDPDSALYLLDGQGNILAPLSPHTSNGYPSVPVEPIERFLTSPLDSLPIRNIDPQDGSLHGFSAARIRFQGERAYLYLVIDGSSLFDKARGVLRENINIAQGLTMLFGSYAATILIGLVSLFLLSKRFEKITSTVRAYRDGMFERRLPVSKADDELDELASTINDMAATIQSSIAELERRDELRRELIANVSHDLRGPASHIRIAAEELVDAARGERRGEESQAVRSLHASSAVLEQMLRELFDLARLEAKEGEPQRRYFSIGELFDDLELRFRTEASEKDLRLTFQAADTLPQLFADPRMLDRALGNLVGNALRYTPRGGSISVSAAPGKRGVLIKVSDTGVGISVEELPHLFERYYRGSELRPDIPGSTGLGLAITRRIIELHDSAIFVESALNEGTNFWFEIATEPAPSPAPAQA